MMRMIGESQFSTGFVDEVGYYGFTVISADAEAGTSLPDSDGDPQHPWYHWAAVQLGRR